MNSRDHTLPAVALLLGVAAAAAGQPKPVVALQAGGTTSEAQSGAEKDNVEPLDINRASVKEFAMLPGIGPELARRIVAFRERHGPFRRIEDLLAIKGLGHKKWRAIRPLICVGGEETGRTRGGTGDTRRKD